MVHKVNFIIERACALSAGHEQRSLLIGIRQGISSLSAGLAIFDWIIQSDDLWVKSGEVE